MVGGVKRLMGSLSPGERFNPRIYSFNLSLLSAETNSSIHGIEDIGLLGNSAGRQGGDGLKGEFSFPGGKVFYFNVQKPEKLRESIILLSRSLSMRTLGGRDPVSQHYVSREAIDSGNFVSDIDPPDISSFSSGLFYIAPSGEVLIKPYSGNSFPSDFGYHKNFFPSLVEQGKLAGTNYEDYPRGFAYYDEDHGVYLVVGGSWLTGELTQKICTSFGFAYDPYPWAYVQSPIYTYRAEGDNAGEILKFV